MSDSKFTTHGNEPLEARIVAWVLGEASPFEIEELERLCDEQPELAIFKRRIESVHGLAAEAGRRRTESDAAWKLSPTRRTEIEQLIGAESLQLSELAREKRIQHSGRQAMLAIAACLVLTLVVATLTWPVLMGSRSGNGDANVATADDDRNGVIDRFKVWFTAEQSESVSGERILGKKAERMVDFSTVAGGLPDELIEGTPKPMNVPGLVDPSRSEEMKAFASRDSKLKAREVAEKLANRIEPESIAVPADAAPMAPATLPAPMVQAHAKSEPGALAGPRKPRSSAMPEAEASEIVDSTTVAKAGSKRPTVSASQSFQRYSVVDGKDAQGAPAANAYSAGDEALAGGGIPVPKGVNLRTPSLDFGESDDFGTGWGSGGAGDKVVDESRAKHKGVEYEINAGYTGEYLFRGVALDEGKRQGAQGGPGPDARELRDADKDLITGGNRSGDFAIAGNSIDSILNNTNGAPARGGEFAGKAGLEGDANFDTLQSRSRGQASETASGDLSRELDRLNEKFNSAQPGAATEESALAEGNSLLFKAKEELRQKKLVEASELELGLDDAEDSKPKQVDITTKHVEVTQANNKESGFDWVTEPFFAERGASGKGSADGSVRTNPALTLSHADDVAEVNRQLELGDGNFQLGRYDDARMAYEKTLETDPYNATARRGLERIAAAKSDYMRAAHDQTRSELLQEAGDVYEIEGMVSGGPPVVGDLPDIGALASREMTRRQSGAAVADQKIIDGRLALANGDYLTASESFKAALEAVPDAPLFAERRELCEAHLIEAQNALRKAEELKEEAKQRPIVSDDEIAAAEEPYSTFSLNISDASFRIAQASLAKGEMPDPTAIKVEQFYNAVDYGDPAPAAGQPVTSNIEQAAHPVIPGRKLVRVAIKTASQGRNQGQPLRLTLLIDQSGSMAREDRRQAMIEALRGLQGLLGENDEVQVIGFARTPRLLAESLSAQQGGQLDQLVNIEANEGGTNLEEAIKLGEQLAERHQLEGAQNRMVLFTDGAANLGDADPESLAEKITELRQKGIAFDIAGIAADGLNDELLGELARHGNGRYYVVGKGGKQQFAEQLAGAFRPAAENVKVQVHFNPERVGRYKLIGFEKDRLNKEDFRNDSVDAAELAAEEAGVAIYQVETLPEGEGEIGEVSVRFRDVASGRMVERSWTVAHDPSAPALDRAQPSMQLAVLSMLAGEKLKDGPLADAINFNDMVESQAKVMQHFRGDARVAEMMQMIDQLK